MLRLTLPTPRPFTLDVVLLGHGWVDLAPFEWSPPVLRFALAIPDGREREGAVDVDVAVDGSSGEVVAEIAAPAAAAPRLRGAVHAALTRLLRLDHDLSSFHALCAREPHLSWVARRGAGRLLAGASLFEDLLKILFTTNCSWAATRGMARRVTDLLGPASRSGRRAFPPAERAAAEPERFWRERVRAGYRARACRELSQAFARGDLSAENLESRERPTAEVRRRLLALRGFGPYAAGQALRLLGRHEDLALDAWCRARIATLLGRRRPPSDRAVERRYARYGEQRGLVLWMELTADWHGEGPRLAPSPLRVAAAEPR